jgi:glycosyltransferase involved in cell wall biosynthesis
LSRLLRGTREFSEYSCLRIHQDVAARLAEHPALSVCIPTYCRCARLRQSIAALLTSTFHNFEIIVSDDASPDGTWDMLKEFDDPRLRCFRNESNLGGWPNWDVAVRKATAPLIFRLDDDDYVDEHFIGTMVALFTNHPDIMSAYSGYAYTRTYNFERNIEVIDSGIFATRPVVPGHEFVRAYLLHDPFPGIHPSSVVYRREAGERVGFYRPDYNDHTFSLALAACGNVGYVPAVHFFYVQHDDNRVSNAQNQDCLARIRDYDPLDAAKNVYESSFAPLRTMPEIQGIKKHVFTKHLRLYPCIQFYTVRNNYHRRLLVALAFFCMARKYPRILLDPVVWCGFCAMLLPIPLIGFLMRKYRAGSIGV